MYLSHGVHEELEYTGLQFPLRLELQVIRRMADSRGAFLTPAKVRYS